MREFLSNKRGLVEWTDKQTNEKGKVRCLLDDKDYITKMKEIKNGSFVDKRDNQEYGLVEINGTTWMSKNLNYTIPENSMCRNNIKNNCDLFGSTEGANNATYQVIVENSSGNRAFGSEAEISDIIYFVQNDSWNNGQAVFDSTAPGITIGLDFDPTGMDLGVAGGGAPTANWHVLR